MPLSLPWSEAPSVCQQEPFHLTAEKTVDVPIMHRAGAYPFLDKEGFSVLSIPYNGRALSMILLVPKNVDGLAGLEKAITPSNLNAWTGAMKASRLNLGLPKFKTTSRFELSHILSGMGMKLAFKAGQADFSGMTASKEGLYIGLVIHQAYVDVHEKGTEAAAATAVLMRKGGKMRTPPSFQIDRPFIFLIRDNKTESILFMGRILDPRGE